MLSLMEVKFEKWCHPSDFRNPSMTIESIILQIKGKSSFFYYYLIKYILYSDFLVIKLKMDFAVSYSDFLL